MTSIKESVKAYVTVFSGGKVSHYKIIHAPDQSKKEDFFFLRRDLQCACRQELERPVL